MMIKKDQIEWISENLCPSFSFQIEDIILYVRKKQTQFKRYRLREEILIGRESNNHLIYLHHMMSKQHARIYFDGEWYIEDLHSKNGVYVNKEKIQKKKLRIGDWISVAGFDIYFCLAFLHCAKPDGANLLKFEAEIKSNDLQPKRQLKLIEKIPPPKLDLPQHSFRSFSLIDDLGIPLIYPLVLLYHGQESIFLYVALCTLGLRVMNKIFISVKQLIRNIKVYRNFRKQEIMYDLYQNERFPTIKHLEKNLYFTPFESLKVRIGTNQGKVIIHDFKKAKRLLIIGDKSKRIEIIKQIIYQLERFYPSVKIHMEQVDYPFVMCYARFRDGSHHFGINRSDYEFTITHLDEINSHHEVYDAILHVNENWYFKDKKIAIKFDESVDDFIFSRNFSYAQTTEKQIQTFLELTQLNELDIEQLRKKYVITTTITGILGYQHEEKIVLDLHEQKQGPHLLVAGMSGSGKSEWLTSFLLSLAIFYDSQEVQFFVIDFKGGGLCSLFEKLHHTCQVLSNLDQYQIHRTIAALEDELALRERILLMATEQVGEPILDIHHLKKEYRNNRCSFDLAHLLIVIDEFAELKLLYPEMMQALVRIARTGRSLGIHLILCTQRPSGIVDRQIESNIQTRLCMKVASKQDSFDMLGNDKAFRLKEAGQWICESGKEYLKGQTAWVDTREQPLVLSDLDRNVKYRIPIQSQSTKSMKIALIQRINDYSHKIKPLFVRSISDEIIPQDALGIYDDYYHRQVVPFKESDSMLILGGKIPALKAQSKEKVSYAKQLDAYEVVLFFEKNEMENLLLKKIPFEMNKQRSLGAIYLKGKFYQCKVRYSVI